MPFKPIRFSAHQDMVEEIGKKLIPHLIYLTVFQLLSLLQLPKTQYFSIRSIAFFINCWKLFVCHNYIFPYKIQNACYGSLFPEPFSYYYLESKRGKKKKTRQPNT